MAARGQSWRSAPISRHSEGRVRSVQPGQHTEPLQDSKVNKMSSICYWEKLESVSKVMGGGFPWWGFPCKAKQVSSRPALGQWRASPPPPADAPRCFLLILSPASNWASSLRPPPHLSITSQAEEVSPRKAFAHSVQDPEFNLQNHLHTRRWFTYLLKLVSLVKSIKHSI